MSEKKTSSVIGGIGFLDALAILFIALKLCKVINWSWWWVLAPIWGQFAIVILVLIIYLIAMIVITLCDRVM